MTEHDPGKQNTPQTFPKAQLNARRTWDRGRDGTAAVLAAQASALFGPASAATAAARCSARGAAFLSTPEPPPPPPSSLERGRTAFAAATGPRWCERAAEPEDAGAAPLLLLLKLPRPLLWSTAVIADSARKSRARATAGDAGTETSSGRRFPSLLMASTPSYDEVSSIPRCRCGWRGVRKGSAWSETAQMQSPTFEHRKHVKADILKYRVSKLKAAMRAKRVNR